MTKRQTPTDTPAHPPAPPSLPGEKWVDCPACHQPSLYAPSNPFRPFCSKLCKATDLGKWAQEEFKVAAPPDAPEASENSWQ